MNRTALFFAIAALTLSPARAALASGDWDPALDHVLLINGGMPFALDEFGNVGPQSITFDIYVDPNPHPVIGFSFGGVVDGITGTPTWASDTRLDIVSPTGVTYSIGGFGGGAAPNDWDFQGAVSDDDGAYIHGYGAPPYPGNNVDGLPDFVFDKITKGGVWSFTFTQTHGMAVWKGVVINLHKQVPAPGTLALLGIAGLIGGRRRRNT